MADTPHKSKLGNKLRADLYTRLFPEVIREDLKTGVDSYIHFWDDPEVTWDDGHLWDEIGVLPILKNIFYAIEEEEGADLTEIDRLTDLVDPNVCPEEFLDYMADSLGHSLEEGLTVEAKRETIKSIMHLNKIRGRELSWAVFYRMLGYQIAGVPLWKKDIYEANDNYSPTRYTTESITDELLGTSGLTNYSGTLANSPIKPGTLRLKVSGKVFRDNNDELSDDYGKLITQDGSAGTINYAKGDYQIELTTPATTNLTANYEHITEEYPYRAARVDLEVFYYLGEESSGIPFDQEAVRRLLTRLEEVRPIHVLVRLVILVLDVPEILEDFCTDELLCGPTLAKDVRSNEYRFYAADGTELGEDEGVILEKVGTTTEQNLLVEDGMSLCLFPDTVTVEFSDGRPNQYL